MELLTNIITGYLKHNKRLVVPRFGAFIVKQPGGNIIFSELMRNDDGVLRSLLIAYGCNELAANGMIDRFAFEIRHKVSQGEVFAIANFGEFSEGENNTICFKHKREPKVFGGTIKPPVERLEDEKAKLQRIQRIRQQQSENLTGHTTHRKLKSSNAIATHNRRVVEEEDPTLGKPDKYLRGLKYENRKGRGNDEEHFGNERPSNNNSGRMVFMLIVAIALGVGGWFIWRWTQGNNATASTEDTPTTENVVEPTDSLATPTEETPVEVPVASTPAATPATTAKGVPATPAATKATPAGTTKMITPLLPTTITTPETTTPSIVTNATN